MLAQPLDERTGFLEALAKRIGNVDLLFEQADTKLTLTRLAVISLVMALAGAGMAAIVRLHVAFWPAIGLAMGFLPILWLFWRRRRRLKAFAVQLPDALDMLSPRCAPDRAWGRGSTWCRARWGRRWARSSGACSKSRISASRWKRLSTA